jgi:hypothetical protein
VTRYSSPQDGTPTPEWVLRVRALNPPAVPAPAIKREQPPAAAKPKRDWLSTKEKPWLIP